MAHAIRDAGPPPPKDPLLTTREDVRRTWRDWFLNPIALSENDQVRHDDLAYHKVFAIGSRILCTPFYRGNSGGMSWFGRKVLFYADRCGTLCGKWVMRWTEIWAMPLLSHRGGRILSLLFALITRVVMSILAFVVLLIPFACAGAYHFKRWFFNDTIIEALRQELLATQQENAGLRGPQQIEELP